MRPSPLGTPGWELHWLHHPVAIHSQLYLLDLLRKTQLLASSGVVDKDNARVEGWVVGLLLAFAILCP